MCAITDQNMVSDAWFYPQYILRAQRLMSTMQFYASLKQRNLTPSIAMMFINL